MPEEEAKVEGKVEGEDFVDETLGDVLSGQEKVQGEEAGEESGEETPEEREEGAEGEIPEEFEAIDPKKLPPELRGHFHRMLNAYTRKMQGMSDKEKKAELWDYLNQNPQFFLQKFQQPTPSSMGREKPIDEQFVESLNLPEENELTPVLKTLATMMVKGLSEFKTKEVVRDQDSLKDKIESFVDSKSGLREDREFLAAMDRIGMESPNLYKNLGRLYNFAKAELGRDHKKGIAKTNTDISKIYKDMKDARKSKVSKPSSSERSAEVKKPKNVKEAFEMAIEQLARKGK